jgi:hypothetical protein
VSLTSLGVQSFVSLTEQEKEKRKREIIFFSPPLLFYLRILHREIMLSIALG